MQTKMFFQCPLLRKPAITLGTLKWTFPFVSSYMAFPCVLMQKAFRAKFAFPWPLSGVSFHMQFKLGRRGKLPTAKVTGIRFFTSMDAHMFLQIAVLRETFLTYLAAVWFMTSVPPAINLKLNYKL